MSHILKGLSKRNTHIPHNVLYDEDKWQKVCSNAYFVFFTGGGHFWRVTHLPPDLARGVHLHGNGIFLVMKYISESIHLWKWRRYLLIV